MFLIGRHFFYHLIYGYTFEKHSVLYPPLKAARVSSEGSEVSSLCVAARACRYLRLVSLYEERPQSQFTAYLTCVPENIRVSKNSRQVTCV